ncbi:hypothetical protein L1987_63524 [Smallanthus sonchifolius]|uniref:Uncharacterized protein n=1 Tax=Smallanthus sonchifolius TaxID=185202 RepID=A0ACB9CDP8_9ASTR|nr:hypothetical protein L1987_63524 [Smallanthus sonchifolius]
MVVRLGTKNGLMLGLLFSITRKLNFNAPPKTEITVLASPLSIDFINKVTGTKAKMQAGEGAMSVMGVQPMDISYTRHQNTSSGKQRTSITVLVICSLYGVHCIISVSLPNALLSTAGATPSYTTKYSV